MRLIALEAFIWLVFLVGLLEASIAFWNFAVGQYLECYEIALGLWSLWRWYLKVMLIGAAFGVIKSLLWCTRTGLIKSAMVSNLSNLC